MGRKEEEHLYDLIKSLTFSEKRSFKQLANYSSSSKKKYLCLFELIERQNQYDENTLKKKLAEEKIITPLPRMKVYLLNHILKSLRFHYSDKTSEGQLRNLLADSEICHSKGLVGLRNKQLEKAKQTARDNEKYEAALMVLRKYSFFSVITPVKEEHNDIMQKIAKLNEYGELFSRVRQLVKEGSIRDKRLKNEWEKLIQNPLMDKDRVPTGLEENYNYCRIWMMYFEQMGDYEKSAYYQELIIEKLELCPEMLKERSYRYMINLNNLIVSDCRLKNTEKATKTLSKLKKMQGWDLNKIEKNHYCNSVILGYSNLIHGLLLTYQYSELASVTNQAEFFVQANKSDSFFKSSLYFQLAVTHFTLTNYKKAAKWLNLFLNEPVKYYREDVHATGRVLNLILHYELGHIDILFYILRSTYRFLYKRKRLYKSEVAILGFIRNKLPKANTPKELIGFFKELKSELEEITKDIYEVKALEYFDFISWLASKIENRPYAEVMKEKANKIMNGSTSL